MKNTLLEKCNADVFKAILDIKTEYPDMGQELINLLQKHEYWWQMTGQEILSFAMPMRDIWNGKVYSFYVLFQSQQTTKMP
jgi:hypothetical protein